MQLREGGGGGGRDGKTKKTNETDEMHLERCNASPRFARSLTTAGNFGFIRTKVSRLTSSRGADMLHERSVRGIAHIESIGEMSVARYTYALYREGGRGTISR